MATRVNDLLAVKQYLLLSGTKHNETASETVPDEVGANVWVGQAPESFSSKSAKGIQIERAGGDEYSGIPVSRPIVQFICYGATWLECETVASAIYDRMHDMPQTAVTEGTILSAQEIAKPVQLPIDEETEDKRVACRYALMVRNT